ncbi:universal stress protein [Saccharopolyspora rhizosphaerae]|uniref:Universal stress protein n=1 Tax=Saccharopolyspora rhizosphaerae TaxID=2492662 RepID=A0A3R8Q6C8_9PSEU|nr:universal stress protein [Saccharopolyspora rhizosphaerae]RRO14131.1 universal stress protein [Saccharopolyspora rhizosphaerae]
MSDLSNAIVVGTDGSDEALSAVSWAAKVASARKLSLHLVSSTEPYYRGFYGAGMPVPPEAFSEIDELARTRLKEATKRAAAIDAELPVTTEKAAEQPISLMLRLSEEAHMLALGASGRGGFTGMLLGSTAASAAAHARCPVAVIRPARTPDGPVVAGVDGSENSVDALSAAFAEASWRRVKLVAVHATRDYEPSIREVGVGRARTDPQEPARVLATSLAGMQERYPDVEVERDTVNNLPRDALLDWSKRAQLVVVGSRGRGGFLGMLLGSNSQTLLQHAACPVLVVHPVGER